MHCNDANSLKTEKINWVWVLGPKSSSWSCLVCLKMPEALLFFFRGPPPLASPLLPEQCQKKMSHHWTSQTTHTQLSLPEWKERSERGGASAAGMKCVDGCTPNALQLNMAHVLWLRRWKSWTPLRPGCIHEYEMKDAPCLQDSSIFSLWHIQQWWLRLYRSWQQLQVYV